jgi:hypothetical protein
MYTNIRFVPGNIGLITSDEAEVPDQYFATDVDTGEEVELLEANDPQAGPEGTRFLARRAGEMFGSGDKAYLPFEAVDEQGNVIGTYNMQKNDPNWINRYVAPVIRTVATVLAGQAIMPSISEALGLDGMFAPETPAGDVPIGGASYAPGSFQEFLVDEGLKVAGATPVPGSLQAYLASIGVNPLSLGGAGAGISSLTADAGLNLVDLAKGVSNIADALNPTQQQPVVMGGGGGGRPQGVDFSNILGLLTGKASLLPAAQQYQRGLLG